MEPLTEKQLCELDQQGLVQYIRGLEEDLQRLFAALKESNRLRACENRQTAEQITRTRQAETERDRVLHANIIEVSDSEGFIDCPFADEVMDSRSAMPDTCRHPKNKRDCGLEGGRDVIPEHCPMRRAVTIIRLRERG